jgi:hypothetical protein
MSDLFREEGDLLDSRFLVHRRDQQSGSTPREEIIRFDVKLIELEYLGEFVDVDHTLLVRATAKMSTSKFLLSLESSSAVAIYPSIRKGIAVSVPIPFTLLKTDWAALSAWRNFCDFYRVISRIALSLRYHHFQHEISLRNRARKSRDF